MAKKKKVKNEVKASEKPTFKLKSINKQEKKKSVGNKNKSKNTIVDSFINQLKNKKKIKNNNIGQLKDKESVKKNDKKNMENKLNTNQNEKKKRRKNKKSLEKLKAANLNGVSSDKQQNSMQKNDNHNEIKKKKRNKKVKIANDNNVRANFDKKNNGQKTIKNFQKDENSVLKRLNINKIKSILREKEQFQIKVSKKRAPSPLSLRDRMMAQLKASRFRFLNEQMYNSESSQSKKFFQDDPQAFYAYHEGYKHQVERWPLNPLDIIIESIKKMPKDYVIADFGCGEAKLAESVPQTVHSFDLVAINDKVKACDMANTPLLTGRTNVVVFCLSLMGSNLGDYLLEANRVLEKDGILKVAEVESRFDKIEDFIKTMANYGFVNTWKDLSHNLFYFMDFKKTKDVLKKNVKKLPALTLKSCLYKKR